MIYHSSLVVTALYCRFISLSRMFIGGTALSSRGATCALIACLLVLSLAETVLAQTISANGATGDVAVYRGATITVNAARSGATRFDWVALYQVGAPHTNRLDWWYMNGSKSAPPTAMGTATFTFAINFDPNAYELRYFANNDYNFLAKSGVVTIQAPRLTINDVVAPQEVTAAPRASVQVHAEGGPAHPGDWVGLYRTGTADAAWLDWATLNGTKTMPSPGVHTATFAMALPMTRGPFEFRWFKANTYTRLATGPVVRTEVRTSVAGGDAHTLMIRPDGSVWASGLNASGQLGTGTTTNSAEPIQVSGLSNVVSVAAGASHSMALTTTGSVYVWGANDLGQVGDGSTTQRTLPTPLSLTNVVAIAAGGDHSLALTSSGEVFAWGRNGSGELGNGTTADSHVPISIATDAVAIAAGERFTLFVKSNGTVWGTGDNEFGALGDGTNTSRTSPGQMSYLSTAVAVRAGKKHSLVLLANGLVNAAGQNHVGQLGDTSVNNRATPAAVSTLTNIVAIGAGHDFSLAVDKDGVAWAWGNNAAGQLGASTPSHRTSPASIAGLSGIGDIAAGSAHTLVLATTGAVTTFGLNTTGQLADGTTSNRSTPAQVSGGGSDWRVATPTLSVASGAYENNVTVVVANTTADSIMRYTQNGNEPTESDPTISSGSTIIIDRSQTLKLRAWKTGMFSSAIGAGVYELRVGTPSLSPPAGTYSTATSVSASTTTAGAVLRYTLDGSEPTAASAEYTGSILIATTSTLKVAAFKINWSRSNVGGGLYAMNFGTLTAPTVTPATGTYTGGATVTMSSAQSGAVLRYTMDGSTPDLSSPAYTAPITITSSGTTAKAKAFHADYTASAETSRTYTLAAAPPTIDPPTGVYTNAQNVTMTAASDPSVTIRYTLDGSEPTEASTPYTAPVAVDTATTIRARSFPNNGWAVSASASAELTFSYGTLAAPTMTPDPGVYASVHVTLTASPGSTIRYSLDGSDPTLASPSYATPFQLPAGTLTVKARAFHPDWIQSPLSSTTFTVDTTPPAIVATLQPSANSAGWNNSPVTVTFTCSDNLTGVNCPAPVALNEDGAGFLVTRVATDAVGNTASASVTVNIDRVAPTLEVTSTVPADTTSPSLEVSASVSDALSGIASATCSGTGASVTAGSLQCAMALKLGRNIVLTTVIDAAGNSASTSSRTLRTTADQIELTVAPTSAAIVVGEQRRLSGVDQFGRVPTSVAWSSSDELVATVSTNEAGEVCALGVGTGTATLTADLNGETATMTLAVYAGASLPVGVARWAAPARAGIAASDTIILSTIGAEDAIYSVEYATSVFGGNKHATVRAIGVDGTENWFGALPVGENETITMVMAHPAGGMIAVLRTSSEQPIPAAVIRYSGDGVNDWRYESGAWQMKAVTGGDGAVFVIEDLVDEGNRSQLVVLEGSNGAVIAKHPLPQLIVSTEGSAGDPPSNYPLRVDPVGLVVDARGHARFLINHGQRNFTASGVGGYASYTLDLYDVAPNGGLSVTTVDSLTHSTSPTSHYLHAESITPDGDGVLALYVRREGVGQDEQWKGKYFGATNSTFSLPGPWRPTVSSLDGYGIGRGMEPTDPIIARSLRNGTVRWQTGAEGDAMVALDGGGAGVVGASGSMTIVDQTGATSAAETLNIAPVPYAYGRFHVRDGNNNLRAMPWKAIDDATAFTGGGGASWAPVPQYGIWAKSHYAAFPFKHAAIRIIPRNQSKWLATPKPWHIYFAAPKMKRYGELVFATISGGPNHEWTVVHPYGFVETKLNEDPDINEDTVDRAIRLWNYSYEDTTITNLFTLASAFEETLPYEPAPSSLSDGYNSSGYLRTLLQLADLPSPNFTTDGFFPGWSKPIPRIYFGVEP